MKGRKGGSTGGRVTGYQRSQAQSRAPQTATPPASARRIQERRLFLLLLEQEEEQERRRDEWQVSRRAEEKPEARLAIRMVEGEGTSSRRTES